MIGTRSLWLVTSCLLAATTSVGCVTQGTFDQLVAADNAEKAAHARCSADLKASQADATARAEALAKTKVEDENRGTEIGEGAAMQEQLRKEIARMRGDIERLVKQKTASDGAIADAHARLDALLWASSRADAAVQVRTDLENKLATFIAAGSVHVVGDAASVHLHVARGALFDAGAAQPRATSRALTVAVFGVLGTVNKARITVVAFVDDAEPIGLPAISKWDLGVARAVETARRIVAAGAPPKQVAAASATGTTDDLEITIEPLGEAPSSAARS